MAALFGIVAFLVAFVGLLAALGNAGYLAMLGSAAKRRAGGEPVGQQVLGQLPKAGGIVAVALVGLLFTTGGVAGDLVGLLLGAVGGLAGYKALEGNRSRFRASPR